MSLFFIAASKKIKAQLKKLAEDLRPLPSQMARMEGLLQQQSSHGSELLLECEYAKQNNIN